MLPTDGVMCFPGQTWEKVLSKVKKAVVFMDDRCSESLHWNGGAALLFEAGARNIKQFSSFEAGGQNEPKAVFVVSTVLKGKTADIIKDIISLSRFQYCVVFTAIPHSIHLLANNVTTDLEGNSVFEQFEEKLCEWMGDMNYTAEVMHAPVVFAPLTQHLHLLPAFSDLFPLLEVDLESINEKRPEKRRFGSLMDVDTHSLSPELQIQIKSLTSAINTLFEFIGTREESFSVGPMSRLIAGELASHPQAKNRRKSAPNKASVVFIDRTLDRTGAVGHHGDSLVEKILSGLPQLPGHVTDIQVDMLELTHLKQTTDNKGILAPGCLAQNQSATARLLWETMLVAKQKEAVMEVRRQLVEAASKENLPIKMSLGRVTAEQLCSYVQLFRDSWGALESHSGVLQLGLAAAQALRHPALPCWDACLAFERLLLQALGDLDLAEVLKQLLPLIKSSEPETGSDSSSGSGELSVDDLLVLLVYVYSMAQEACPGGAEQEKHVEKVENELIGALTLRLTQQTSLSPLLQEITGVSGPEELTVERAHSALENVFEMLRGVCHARDPLKHFSSVYTPSDGAHQATYRPLLKQVLEEIFHPDRRECPDVEHMSGGLTDLLKTGFSMFMKVTRPHPSDHPLLFLFLVGGVTPSELRLIRDVVSTHKSGTQVLVMSTRLLRPCDVPHLLFSIDRLKPDIGV
ncbi:sec1 family domain-containing protein 2-like [Sinocyclocheilus anshuiensis]|uniref:Sec1 family domain-containing protein 2-like n=1 Tax=Sinocyclocheilus anshuiensis TaxID=1608454 RepID=A0A671NQP1_9TELE|nr:PREDICTED: sec1 family domain-containing protein 2-like [Sinocyclocheilus anshuiensis]